MKAYLTRVIGAYSQLMNVMILMGDRTNESVSARCYRRGLLEGNRYWRKAMTIIDWLFKWFEYDHCRKAYQSDLLQAQRLINDTPKGVFSFLED